MDIRALIGYRHVKGRKLSYDKALMSQPEVIYLGRKISQANEKSRTTALQRSGQHQNPEQSYATTTGIGWKTPLKSPNH